jgi:hypothetical protein
LVSGVGAGFKPPKWLVPGTKMEVNISGIGTLSNHVVKRLQTSKLCLLQNTASEPVIADVSGLMIELHERRLRFC